MDPYDERTHGASALTAPRTQNALGKVADAPLSDAGRAQTVTDGAALAAVLIEGLRPGAFDAERAEAARKAILERAQRIQRGDVSGIEIDLTAQAAWLDALIETCLAKGTAQGLKPSAAAQWLAIALRAASVRVRTVGALAGVVALQGKMKR